MHLFSPHHNWTLEEMPVTAAARAARLRRVCERKPTGKLNCPEWLHDMWKNTANRNSLTEKLEASNWDKDRSTVFCLTSIMLFWVTFTYKTLTLHSVHRIFNPSSGGIRERNDRPAWASQSKEVGDHERLVFGDWYAWWTWMETEPFLQ